MQLHPSAEASVEHFPQSNCCSLRGFKTGMECRALVFVAARFDQNVTLSGLKLFLRRLAA